MTCSGDLLCVIANGLAAAAESGRRTLEIIRAASPELVCLSWDGG